MAPIEIAASTASTAQPKRETCRMRSRLLLNQLRNKIGQIRDEERNGEQDERFIDAGASDLGLDSNDGGWACRTSGFLTRIPLGVFMRERHLDDALHERLERAGSQLEFLAQPDNQRIARL